MTILPCTPQDTTIIELLNGKNSHFSAVSIGGTCIVHFSIVRTGTWAKTALATKRQHYQDSGEFSRTLRISCANYSQK
jgi:hypothetical protein